MTNVQTSRTTTANTNVPTPLVLFSATVILGLNWMRMGCDVNVSDLYYTWYNIEPYLSNTDPKANGIECLTAAFLLLE